MVKKNEMEEFLKNRGYSSKDRVAYIKYDRWGREESVFNLHEDGFSHYRLGFCLVVHQEYKEVELDYSENHIMYYRTIPV